jgi:hypothetical protein
MSLTAEQLFQLLPAVMRRRDVEHGEPLKALVTVLAEAGALVDGDIEGLYENWFIETCDEWVVPYIGDLLGVRGLHALTGRATINQRARVANTIAYRRRKGTISMLEALARDTTGWNARAVEFFQHLSTTQNLNHVRLDRPATVDLRKADALELLDGPFDAFSHTADIRPVASGAARHGIANIGLFLWRLQSYFLPFSTARAVTSPPDGRYRFDALGADSALFNRPRTEAGIDQLAGEINVPGRLGRRSLYRELEGRRQDLVDGATPRTAYFGPQPVFQVFVREKPEDGFEPVAPERILICDLSDPPAAIPQGWRRPPTGKTYTGTATGTDVVMPVTVAVDPVLGRIAFPEGILPDAVKVSYAYGFSGDLGGGAYQRGDVLADLEGRPVEWQVAVSTEEPAVPGAVFASLGEAIGEWNQQPPGTVGVIAVTDNHLYEEALTGANRIEVPEGSLLFIVAADWPKLPVKDGVPGQTSRIAGHVEASERRPCLIGDVEVTGTAPADSRTPGTLVIDGLLIDGRLDVVPTGDDEPGQNLGRLCLRHCRMVPGKGGVSVSGAYANLRIELDHAISGPVTLPDTVPGLGIADSLVVGGDGIGAALSAPGAVVTVERATVFGTAGMQRLEASDSIFTGTVTVDRRQVGCVRFSYVPAGSVTPRRYRCQPDTALAEVAATEQQALLARLGPAFTSDDHHHPGFGQLAASAFAGIRTGAEDGSEMGAFNFLKQPQRDANLRAGLREYLRFGLEAGLIYVS